MDRTPVAAGLMVKKLLKEFGIDWIIEQHAIWSCWEEIVGPEVASKTRPEFFSGKRLFIAVEHSSWLHQLNFLKDQLILNINRKLGFEAVSEIHLRIGSILCPEPRPKNRTPEKIMPSKAEEKEIEDSLRLITDPEIRNVLYRIMFKDLTEKKSQAT
ncbi:MAG: DUF721 domain-containing protein [bacterium]